MTTHSKRNHRDVRAFGFGHATGIIVGMMMGMMLETLLVLPEPYVNYRGVITGLAFAAIYSLYPLHKHAPLLFKLLDSFEAKKK